MYLPNWRLLQFSNSAVGLKGAFNAVYHIWKESGWTLIGISIIKTKPTNIWARILSLRLIAMWWGKKSKVSSQASIPQGEVVLFEYCGNWCLKMKTSAVLMLIAGVCFVQSKLAKSIVWSSLIRFHYEGSGLKCYTCKYNDQDSCKAGANLTVEVSWV